MKKIILNFETKSKNFNELVQAAFNSNIVNFLVSEDSNPAFKNIERVNIYSRSSEVKPKYLVLDSKERLTQQTADLNRSSNLGFYMELKSKEDETKIKQLFKAGQLDFIIVAAKDWKVIPFENLIAETHTHDTELIAEVQSVKEAELMLKTLEIGVDGILIKVSNSNDIVELKKLLLTSFKFELTKAKVVNILTIPEGDRVCVDTTSILRAGEGMLVGSTAMGFALVHAEVFETQFVASRPFRVNAGDVSAYILVPNEDAKEGNVFRTNYLSELKGGDKVFAVNAKGDARIVSVGRVKIETRPMIRFELETLVGDKKVPIKIICQNAETIRLVDLSGKAKSVVDVKIGDEVLIYVGPGATHFGTAIKETIIEK